MSDNKFPSAKIVAHSQAPNGEELICYEIELHKFIVAQNNTHRALSKNYQSSRAIPVLRQLDQIINDPAMPVYYGTDQSGMVAGKELEGLNLELAKMIILGMRDACVNGVKQLQKLGLAKESANRYVEPWMKTKGVISGTRKAFEAFFKLRIHKAAQGEIAVLAKRMKEALDNSVPVQLNYGEYHLPYVKSIRKFTGEYCPVYEQLTEHDSSPVNVYLDINSAVKISCSCIAQTSYRRLDDSLEKALKVYAMLDLPINGVYPEDPPHYSPTEHIAKVMDESCYDGEDKVGQMNRSGNFNSATFWQYRKALEMGLEKYFLEGDV